MTTLGESLRKIQEERKSKEPITARGYVSNHKIYTDAHELLKDIGYVSKDVFQCTICDEWHEDITLARNCCDIESVKKSLNESQNGIAYALKKLEHAKKDYRDACDWHKTLELKLNKIQLLRIGDHLFHPKKIIPGECDELNAKQVKARMDAARHAMEYVINSERGTVCPCPKCKKGWYTEQDALRCCS